MMHDVARTLANLDAKSFRFVRSF